MSCDVAPLPFKVHYNYGTWSIDFDPIIRNTVNKFPTLKFYLIFKYITKLVPNSTFSRCSSGIICTKYNAIMIKIAPLQIVGANQVP